MSHKSVFISCVLSYGQHSKANGGHPVVRLNPDHLFFLGDNGYYQNILPKKTSDHPKDTSLPANVKARNGGVVPVSSFPPITDDFTSVIQAFTQQTDFADIFDAYATNDTSEMRISWVLSDNDSAINDYSHKYYVGVPDYSNVGLFNQADCTAFSLTWIQATTPLLSGTQDRGASYPGQKIPVYNPPNTDPSAVAQYGGFQAATWPAGQEATRAPVRYFRIGFDIDGTRNDVNPSLVEYFILDGKTACDPPDYLTDATRNIYSAAQETWITTVIPASTAIYKVIAGDDPPYFLPTSAPEFSSYVGGSQADGFKNFTTQRDRILDALKDVTGLVWIAGDDHTAAVITKSSNPSDASYLPLLPNGFTCAIVPSWASAIRPTISPTSARTLLDTAPSLVDQGIIFNRRAFGFCELDVTPDLLTLNFRNISDGAVFGTFTLAPTQRVMQRVALSGLFFLDEIVAGSGDRNAYVDGAEFVTSPATARDTAAANAGVAGMVNSVKAVDETNNPDNITVTTNIPDTFRLVPNPFTLEFYATENVPPYRTLKTQRLITFSEPSGDSDMLTEQLLTNLKLSTSLKSAAAGNIFTTDGTSNQQTNKGYIDATTGILTFQALTTAYESFFGKRGWLIPGCEAKTGAVDATIVPGAGAAALGQTKADGTGTAARVYSGFPATLSAIANGYSFDDVIIEMRPRTLVGELDFSYGGNKVLIPLNIFPKANEWYIVNFGQAPFNQYVTDNTNVGANVVTVTALNGADCYLSHMNSHLSTSGTAYDIAARMVPVKANIFGATICSHKELDVGAAYSNDFTIGVKFILPAVRKNLDVELKLLAFRPSSGGVAQAANSGIGITLHYGTSNSYIQVDFGTGTYKRFCSKHIPSLASPEPDLIHHLVLSKSSSDGIAVAFDGVLVYKAGETPIENSIVASDDSSDTLNALVGSSRYIVLGIDRNALTPSKSSAIVDEIEFWSAAKSDDIITEYTSLALSSEASIESDFIPSFFK